MKSLYVYIRGMQVLAKHDLDLVFPKDGHLENMAASITLRVSVQAGDLPC
jgi:hypothetical protein